ncbi:MAG: hypothetical protein IPK08_00320 [Bacteroidetes bacterium]|nr:hypothetical protein [Bacteroidota bacterium]
MKKTMSKMMLTALIAVSSAATGVAQTNLGADCGCPAVGSRTSVNMSTLAVSGGATDGDLTATSTILTCDKIYVLDKKIFVPSGKSITIQPGTLIKANTSLTPGDATALVVSRGGKIFAAGTQSCPIVFTAAADPMNGTYGVTNQGQWGGLVILGKAKNNLVAGNTLAISTGVGIIEGFATADPRAYYGEAPGSEDANDNSGIVQYVSLRHGGATVGPNNELNGLTLGSVGRGTTLDHIEVVANSDDGIEFFGGTVDLKYGVVMFNDDDGFDWDQGWSGKGQFWVVIKVGTKGDNGFEIDGDDNTSGAAPLSHPFVYNATFIGDATDAGIEAKELTEGEIYNSILANYAQGFNLYNVRAGGDAYGKWNGGQLKVNNCTFIGNVAGFTIQTAGNTITPAAGADLTKFNTDGNIVAASVPGFDFAYAMNLTTNAITDQYDATPNPSLTSSITPPVDDFFQTVTYRGAFADGETSLMTNWTYSAFVDASNGLVNCPTDLNGDGITKVEDFLILVGQFNLSCD